MGRKGLRFGTKQADARAGPLRCGSAGCAAGHGTTSTSFQAQDEGRGRRHISERRLTSFLPGSLWPLTLPVPHWERPPLPQSAEGAWSSGDQGRSCGRAGSCSRPRAPRQVVAGGGGAALVDGEGRMVPRRPQTISLEGGARKTRPCREETAWSKSTSPGRADQAQAAPHGCPRSATVLPEARHLVLTARKHQVWPG